MINRRFCELKDHQNNPIVFLCTNKICTQYSRWICIECNNLQLHDHQQNSQNHIIEIKQFQMIKCIYQQHVEQFKKIDFTYLQNLKEIEDHIQFTNQLILSQDEENQNINYQFNMFEGDISGIDTHQLNSVVNFQSTMIKNYTKILQTLKFVDNKIKNIISGIESIITALKEKDNNKNTFECIQEQIDTFDSQMSYQQVCDINVSDESFSAKISPNEQLLLCCNKFDKLQLINIQQQKSLFTQQQKALLDLKQPINLVEFTQDSRSIVLCTRDGIIKVYNLRSNCCSSFTNLVLINQNFILTSQKDKHIIITDLITHKQQLKLSKSSNKPIQMVDFDEEHQVIISGFENQIDFNNIQGQLLFIHAMKFGIYMDQLQYIKNNYIFISGSGQIFLWQVNYQSKKLILINKFQLEGNFYQVFSHSQQIFIVKFSQIDVLDINFNLIQEIPHQTSDLQFVRTSFKYSKALNLIYVQGQNNLQIIKLQR